jgi:hypothetical protein
MWPGKVRICRDPRSDPAKLSWLSTESGLRWRRMASQIRPEDYVGLQLSEAEAFALSQGWQPRSFQVDEAITLEYNPERINLHVDAQGMVYDVSAG